MERGEPIIEVFCTRPTNTVMGTVQRLTMRDRNLSICQWDSYSTQAVERRIGTKLFILGCTNYRLDVNVDIIVFFDSLGTIGLEVQRKDVYKGKSTILFVCHIG